MTCEDAREYLLTADIGDLDPVRTHLSQCARCAELAAAVARSESDLRQHVETFVNTTTLDSQWERALERAGPVPRARFPLHRLLLAAAAAAVLTVIAVPSLRSPGSGGPPDDPIALGVGAVPEGLRQARQEVEAFERIDPSRLDVAGLDQEGEDQLMMRVLQDKIQALTRADAALTEATSEGEPRWRVSAYRELGQLHAQMAEAMLTFHQPSYLTDEQLAVYRRAMAERVVTQQGKALQHYEAGAALAREHALPTSASELDALAEQLRLRSLRVRFEANADCFDANTAAALRAQLDQARPGADLSELATRLDQACE